MILTIGIAKLLYCTASLQELNIAYEVMVDQILHSTSACLDLHEVLSMHHLALRARQKVCDHVIVQHQCDLLGAM